jgi:hypothetical protein
VTRRHEIEDGSTASGQLVDRRGHSEWDAARPEPSEEQRDRIAWNLPLPRSASATLASEPAAPLGPEIALTRDAGESPSDPHAP